jgi:DNA repair protein RecO (recombination protein O)
MSAEQTHAIILRIYPWSESSCVAVLYTRDFGKQAVLAKGAWRSRSPFEGALDLLSICRVVFLPKAGDALGILAEAKLVERFGAGRHDLLRLYCGFYVAETLDRFTEKGLVQPELYELGVATLTGLCDVRQEPRACVLRWELQLLRLLGHQPTLEQCAQCGNPPEQSATLVFAPVAGGIVCPACAVGLRPLIRLPSVVRDELLRFGTPEWQAIDTTNFNTQHRATFRGTIERYLTALLDRKLQLTDFLEELAH